MKHSRKNDEGIALMLTVFALIIILGAVAIVSYRANTAKRQTDFTIVRAELEEACKAGIDIAVEQYWNQYVVNQGNTTGNLASYFAWIDNFSPGQPQTNEDVNHSGGQDGEEWDANGNGQFDVNPPVAIATPEEPIALASGSQITDLTVERFDDVTGTSLTLRVTAEKSGHSQSAVQTIRIAGELFEGFEFAILANNINCILCHADFLNLDLQQNADPNNYGTFDRIKIAALESLLIRTSEAHSNISGSTYTRGRVYDKNGNELSASTIANSTLNAHPFDSSNGKIMQDGSGDVLDPVSLVNAGADDQGRPNQFANLYLDYPSDHDMMTDGNLPTHFPSPFPDDDGDRYISDTEFDKVMNSANGYIQFELDPDESGGTIQGGVAYGIPEGSSFSGTELPTASNEALTALTDTGFYDGNLILVGNDADPIVIDKKVAVNGDLVIKGPVKGWGQVLVRGNTYIVGDITYADGDTYGVAPDGTKNGFALTTGGSIMIGDYTTNRAKNNWKDGSPDYVDPYVWQGKFIQVDQEHCTQTMSNGEQTAVGYFDDGAVDAGWPVGDEGMYSFTTSELMLFNRMEHLKAQADPSYTPRYYQLRDTAPVYEYIVEDVTNSSLLEHAVNYFCPGVETIPDLDGAAVHSLNPSDYWLTEDQLRHFWWADEAERRAKGGRQPMRFDGLLYSNNSIFAVVRSYGRHKSRCYGTFDVRGSIVCADLGVLMIDSSDSSNTGMNLQYDRRVADFLRVEDTTQVEFRRVAFRYE